MKLSVSDLLELAFFSSARTYEQRHKMWRALHRELEALRVPSAPADAGDADARLDCLLCVMEDDQLMHQQSVSPSAPHDGGRLKLQIQLTRYWIASSYELLRMTWEATPASHPHRSTLRRLCDEFGSYRIPLFKQQPQSMSKPGPVGAPASPDQSISAATDFYQGSGSYRAKTLMNRSNGSVGFQTWDGKSQSEKIADRRSLSDRFLALADHLKN